MSQRPGNAARGWNDPPEFLHNTGAPINKRTILNQRVAHSLDTSGNPLLSTSMSTSHNSTLPPSYLQPTQASIQHQQEMVTITTALSEKSNADIDQLNVEQIEQILNKCVQSLIDEKVPVKLINKLIFLIDSFIYFKRYFKNYVKVKTCDDLLKRIKIFIDNWNKLNDVVKTQMSVLSKCKLFLIFFIFFLINLVYSII